MEAHKPDCTSTDPEIDAMRDCPGCRAYLRAIHEMEMDAEDAPVRLAEAGDMFNW